MEKVDIKSMDITELQELLREFNGDVYSCDHFVFPDAGAFAGIG